ncbi:MAG: nicotinate-nucleotide--dimethylbenzimidazole phosphoribosyltransferase [Chloroflexota bacterium]|nr:nicotinate-nucleotide--dimethylbenzimidazole phosphoribosyltransferase [Chloroflexota bacterium]
MLKISLEETVAGIGPLDGEAMAAAGARQDELIKPKGSLGMLEDISVRLAGIFSQNKPTIENKIHILAAGDHGVVVEGVSAYPQEVTPQMVMNFLAGGAAINVLARHVDVRVIVVDAGVNAELPPHPDLISMPAGRGTANMAQGPAMSLEQARLCIENGISIAAREIESGADLIGTGDMGIGNTTAASAITSVICDIDPLEVTGLGAGIAEDQREHKANVIRKAIDLNRPDPSDGLDVLTKLGGFEIGFLAGVMLGAAAAGRPVLIDGFISGAAALIAYTICPAAKDYMIASHLSVERGHGHALQHIGLKPILDLGMRLGEGTGAALAMLIVEAAAKCLAEMPTFAEAGVSDKE